MDEDHLQELAEQIAALEAVDEQTEEITQILEELRACHSAILEVQTAHEDGRDDCNGDYGDPTGDSDSDMTISDNDEYNVNDNNGMRKRRRIRRRRRVRPWLRIKDEMLEAEDIKELREIVEQQRLESGVDLTLMRNLWSAIHSKYLRVGHLIAFGLRCFNGRYDWYPGTVEEFDWSDDHVDGHVGGDSVDDDHDDHDGDGQARGDDCSDVESDSPSGHDSSKQSVTHSRTDGCNSNDDPKAEASHDQCYNHDTQHASDDCNNPVDEDKQQPTSSSQSRIHSIRVSFAAPMESKQIKCLHYNSGRCHFRTRCSYSHGRWVSPELCRFLFWDPKHHLKVNNRVFFLPPQFDLWKEGIVIAVGRSGHADIDTDQISKVQIQCSQTLEQFIIANLDRILPVLRSEDFSGYLPGDQKTEVTTEDSRESLLDERRESYCLNSTGDVESDSADAAEIANESEILNSKNCPQWFAFWEKHTKGFGSRMLRKMGYKMGEPLRPPSLRSTDPVPLTEPLPIRLLPPRVSLDYLSRQRKKGASAGPVLEFRKSGDEERAEDEKKREALIMSKSVFGLMNRSEMSQSYSELQRRQEGEAKQQEVEHQKILEKTRRGENNDESLRTDLLKLERKLGELQNELKKVKHNLGRHGNRTGVGSSQFESIYANSASQKENEIRKVKEQIKAIEERLQVNRVSKKLLKGF